MVNTLRGGNFFKLSVYHNSVKFNAMKVIIGIVVILHGLIHLLYYGQSLRKFELRPGFDWPDDSWLFTKFLRIESKRKFAAVLCSIVAAAFTFSGIGYVFSTNWHILLIHVSVILSTLLFLFFWNGKL